MPLRDPDLVNRLRALPPADLGAVLRFLNAAEGEQDACTLHCANHPRPLPRPEPPDQRHHN